MYFEVIYSCFQGLKMELIETIFVKITIKHFNENKIDDILQKYFQFLNVSNYIAILTFELSLHQSLSVKGDKCNGETTNWPGDNIIVLNFVVI